MPAAAPAAPAATITVASDLLGPVEVAPEARYHFPAGLYGFADARDFALVPAGPEGLCWLQSLERPSLVLLVADPFRYFADYAPDVPDAELAQLGADAPGGRGRGGGGGGGGRGAGGGRGGGDIKNP